MGTSSIGGKLRLAIFAISTIVILIALVFGYVTNNKIEDQRMELRAKMLKGLVKEKLSKKLDVGITNAVGFSANPALTQAVLSNNREDAISVLKTIGESYKKNTNFKGIKVHLHTKDIKSFVRSWKLGNFGDDLSTFRDSIQQVKSSQKATALFELGRSGMFIRGIVPLMQDNSYIGSLEFMQGVGSINRDFAKKDQYYMMVLNEDATSVATSARKNPKFGKYYVSNPKWFNKQTMDFMGHIDIDKLLEKGYIINDTYFATVLPLKDFKGNLAGYHIIGEKNTIIKDIINHAKMISYTYIGLLIVSILLIIATISYSIRKTVINKINSFEKGLLDFFDYLNGKSSTITPLEISSNDEIGVMAKVVNENINKTKQILDQDKALIKEANNVIQSVKKGSLNGVINSSTQNGPLEEFKNGVNDMLVSMKQNFTQINQILEQYKNYNYLNELKLDNIEKGTSVDQLIVAINALREAINEMLIENKRGGIMLNTSSENLITNVYTLSSSSNEAAASLEQTAAALEEMTSNIASNTQNIIKMAGFANNLTSKTKEGQELANQTTSSMDEINTQVTAINEAISVIDQIAFQTNILSLNAAVEAATAGEAGKGFAVVAQEVRNLASRSAEAASEIKSLVENATNKANDGKHIADKMIAGYHELSENITSTTEVIKDIESASKEQQTGIEQINDAVNQLDKQTQENAKVAAEVQTIANTTSAVASKIVEQADNKEFLGKNDVDRRKKPLNPTYQGSEKRDIESRIKKIEKTDTIQPITSKANAEDDWSSF